ncbi:MAG: hypothetical protein CMC96_14695 [Flavobacteriales bacterium]|nr:hypothetical protein [Flavobacteriales bacterium]|tara:strand:+ start:47513 stop:48208 length:696 start_codon:yes stop_codon:yes gene_type:complete
MEIRTIIWIFITIFSITAIITLLGITNIIKGIREKYLDKLFYTLIIEVVIAVIAVFQGIDFNKESIQLKAVIKSAEIKKEFNNEVEEASFIVERLKESLRVPDLEVKLKKVQKQNISLEEELDSCSLSLSQIEKSFYSKISKLRDMISYYSGSINLNYKAEEKQKVFRTLEDIFEILGYLKDGDSENIKALQSQYKQFEKRNGVHKRGELIITEFETTLLIREYLNKFYPI